MKKVIFIFVVALTLTVSACAPQADFTNTIGMSFKLIPSGNFMMGSPETEEFRDDNEAQHPATIASPFSLGVHEVTQSQYESVMGNNPSYFKGGDNPVEKVSWDDAVAFCTKLSALPAEVAAGRVYRLPTEAEWEYACRAGSTTTYSFGDDAKDLGKYAWFGDSAGRTTHAVGQKLPNGWGLYDMHGNVWEWCTDAVAAYPVLRGGGWFHDAALCRSAYCGPRAPTRGDGNRGFRLVLNSPSVKSPAAERDR
jgi:formylglycine-generating enzyme required for sulfatase activity